MLGSVTTLEPFAQLAKLQELYARKNSIASLAELRHLAKSRHLRSLWLVDNPCAVGLDKEEYRLRVLRALPQLETLDNCEVTTHERLLTSSGDGELEAYLQTRKKPPVSSPVASTTPLRSPERRHTQQLHAPGPRTVPRGTTWVRDGRWGIVALRVVGVCTHSHPSHCAIIAVPRAHTGIDSRHAACGSEAAEATTNRRRTCWRSGGCGHLQLTKSQCPLRCARAAAHAGEGGAQHRGTGRPRAARRAASSMTRPG